MFKYIFYLLIFIVIIYMIKNHVKVKYKTFLQRGFYKTSKPYGVYCYCGKQGKGKTYSVVEFLLENKDKEIYSNINSIVGVDYKYINGIEELLALREKKNCIIVFDEIFTILQKGTKMSGDILDFLSQMRKREMIFITTAQEWLEINITLRRYCRYQIECNMLSILGYPILIKKMYDAEQMKWSQEDNEYVAPIISTTISHGLKKVISSYDTYEQIGKYSSTNKSLKIAEKNTELDDVCISEVSVSPETSEQDESSELLNYYTTTYSNSIVNSQFTNILQNETENSQNIQIVENDIDKGFWSDININDIDDESVN